MSLLFAAVCVVPFFDDVRAEPCVLDPGGAGVLRLVIPPGPSASTARVCSLIGRVVRLLLSIAVSLLLCLLLLVELILSRDSPASPPLLEDILDCDNDPPGFTGGSPSVVFLSLSTVRTAHTRCGISSILRTVLGALLCL